MESASYIFNSEAVKKLLTNKFVVFIGDSVVRSMYKDFVLLLQEDRMLSSSELKRKGELSFRGDELIEGGTKGEMTNGKNYMEVRQYCEPSFLLRFYFVTRVYSPYMETVIADLVADHPPDIVMINSCLWDITRYGAQSMVQFEMNIQKLCHQLKRLLAPDTLVMWLTTMPVAQSVRGGFLTDEISFVSEVLRVDVLLANYYASQVVSDHEFDVLDLHYEFRRQTGNRAGDGIHWNGVVHRAVSNVLLRHVCDAWHVELPASSCLPRLSGFQSESRSVSSANDYGRRLGPQRNLRPFTCRRNVDFTSDDFSHTNWNGNRHFGSDLTNEGQPRQTARRGRWNQRKYRQRPY